MGLISTVINWVKFANYGISQSKKYNLTDTKNDDTGKRRPNRRQIVKTRLVSYKTTRNLLLF